MPFESQLAVREIETNCWRLVEELEYAGSQETITVPVDTQTDFASVPQIFQWFIPRFGKYYRSAVLHDYLCVEAAAGRFDRADADGIFRRSMREVGVGYLRRRLMWVGVRLGEKLAGASVPEALIVIAISILAAPFVLIAIVVAQILVWLYQLVELLVYFIRWAFKRVFRKPLPDEQPPKPSAFYKVV